MDQYAFTRLLNHRFSAESLLSIMQGMGIHPATPGAPIGNIFAAKNCSLFSA